jgi:glycosyl transferase family 25
MFDQLAVRVIHLQHRADRRAACDAEWSALGFDPAQMVYADAKRVDGLGAMGCALSHALTLTRFLVEDERPFMLMLEDDFQVVNKRGFRKNLEAVLRIQHRWDVFLLAHNTAVPIERLDASPVVRVIGAQTTSGYIVRRSFVPKLVACFLESAEQLQQLRNLPPRLLRAAQTHMAPDMAWKPLQMQARFLATMPALAVQRASFSDIEGKAVDYGV